jgi:molybdate transport system regulatory protein
MNPENHSMQSIDIDVRVMLKDEEGEPFMGIGVIWLLTGIEKHHSISQAAREMELSYPKALHMIQSLEDTLQMGIVRRYKGGHLRGGAELTAAGKDFIERYLAMLSEIKKNSVEIFEKRFQDFFSRDREADDEDSED